MGSRILKPQQNILTHCLAFIMEIKGIIHSKIKIMSFIDLKMDVK